MRISRVQDFTPLQKKIAAGALALTGLGGATALYLSRDMIAADIAISKHFAQAAKEIEPHMWTAGTVWNLRYYMRNCNYTKPPKPHSYELQGQYSAIPVTSARESMILHSGIAETLNEADSWARLKTDRDYEVGSFSYGDVRHFKAGKVCHGAWNTGCVDSFTRGVIVKVNYEYEEKETYCAAEDKDGNCTREDTRYVTAYDSVSNRYSFETIAGMKNIMGNPVAFKLNVAAKEAVDYGLSQHESRIKCPPVSGYTGGGGASSHEDWGAPDPMPKSAGSPTP